MVMQFEEMQEAKLDEQLERLFKKDYLLERKDVKQTLRMYKDAKKELKLIKKELKSGVNQNAEIRKKKLLNEMVRFLILRKRGVMLEMNDINAEYKELNIEEKDETNLLQNK